MKTAQKHDQPLSLSDPINSIEDCSTLKRKLSSVPSCRIMAFWQCGRSYWNSTIIITTDRKKGNTNIRTNNADTKVKRNKSENEKNDANFCEVNSWHPIIMTRRSRLVVVVMGWGNRLEETRSARGWALRWVRRCAGPLSSLLSPLRMPVEKDQLPAYYLRRDSTVATCRQM